MEIKKREGFWSWSSPELLSELPELLKKAGDVRIPRPDTHRVEVQIYLSTPIHVANWDLDMDLSRKPARMNGYTKAMFVSPSMESVLLPHEGDTAIWLKVDLWGLSNQAPTLALLRANIEEFAHTLATDGVCYNFAQGRECHPEEMQWAGTNFLHRYFGPDRQPLTEVIPYAILQAVRIALPSDLMSFENGAVEDFETERYSLDRFMGLSLSSAEKSVLIAMMKREHARLKGLRW